MSLAHKLRLRLRGLGVDVARWPETDPQFGLHAALFSVRPDVLLDVGANGGGFVQACRSFGYRGPVYSFEPASEAFEALTRAARTDADWHVERIALGDSDESATLHIAGNQQASSSLLPMLALHEEAAPEAAYVATEPISVARLDTWMERGGYPWQRIAMKVDVQGFERQVLDGAHATLPRVASLQIELSTRHLYAGDWLWDEASSWLAQQGLELAGVAPGFTHPDGRMLQFDAVFVR